MKPVMMLEDGDLILPTDKFYRTGDGWITINARNFIWYTGYQPVIREEPSEGTQSGPSCKDEASSYGEKSSVLSPSCKKQYSATKT